MGQAGRRTGETRPWSCEMPEETRCVVSLGVDSPSPPGHPEVLFQDFSRGLARIREDLQRLDFSGDFLAWDQRYPMGSPTQEQAAYAYKPFCLDEVRRQGHRWVLWLDASIRIEKPLEPLFEIIEKDGYLIFEASHSVGEPSTARTAVTSRPAARRTSWVRRLNS